MSNQINGWIGLLSDVYGLPVSTKLDAVDIAWHGLPAAFVGLTEREISVLRLRYFDGLKFSDCGSKLGKKTNRRKPLSTAATRMLCLEALRKLRHPKRVRILRSCISGWWNLECD